MVALPPPVFSLVIAMAAALPPVLPCQRGVAPLTSGLEGHADVRISPSGTWIAFATTAPGTRGVSVIGSFPAAKEVILYASGTFIDYFWRPDSTGIFFQDGNALNFVRTVGGPSVQVRQVSGVNVRFRAIDPTGIIVFGTRSDAAGAASIFRLPADGSAGAQDILTSASDFFDELRIAPGGQRIAYTRQTNGVPHAPVMIRAADLDGQNDALLVGPLTGQQPRDLAWIDASTLAFTAVDLATSAWAILRSTANPAAPERLTAGPQHFRASSVSPDRRWIVFQAQTAHGHQVPGILPATGGGRILLEPETDWNLAGPPAMDPAGQRVVFAGSDRKAPPGTSQGQQIFLDREVRVAPRAALGQQVKFELPLLAGEKGTLFLSLGLLHPDPMSGPSLIVLPGITYAVALNPNVLIPILSAIGTGPATPASVTAAVPNDPALVGLTVYLQGLRVATTNPDTGDFTRYVELQFL